MAAGARPAGGQARCEAMSETRRDMGGEAARAWSRRAPARGAADVEAAALLLLALRDGEERRRSEAARRGEGIVVDGTQAARGGAAPGRCGGQAWAGCGAR
jgi:hypothetical protein